MKYSEFIGKAGMTNKSYQEEGVKRMLALETVGWTGPYVEREVHGGFLADEMGLGKTLQLIAVMLGNPRRRTLIVVPPVLLEQWQRAILDLTNHKCLVYHRSAQPIGKIPVSALEQANVVLTTYGMVAVESGKRGNALHGCHPGFTAYWDRVIFDEAHHLRNPNTRIHHGARMLRADARWMVSGTPVQNCLSDLRALLRILGVEGYPSSQLQLILKALMIRRTKLSVGIKLPPLETSTSQVAWMSDAESELASDLHAPLGICNGGRVPGLVIGTGSILPALTRARQSCILPRLTEDPVLLALEDVEDKPALAASIGLGLGGASKVTRVVSDLLKEDGKCLVFCHYRGEIDRIRRELSLHGVGNSYIDGRIGSSERSRVIESAPQVLLLQIQTCCEGLNLQEYSCVYVVSPHWNPAIEDQAVARCHRIGQTATVRVRRYIQEAPPGCSLSLDARADQVQEAKRDLSKVLPQPP